MNIKINDVYDVEIIGQENDGLGVARIDSYVVFVEDALKADRGKIVITEVKKNYARGKMIELITESGERVIPKCPYYSNCGGCELQHQSYDMQVLFKLNKIKMALEHIGGLKDIKVNDIIIDAKYNYRNKVTLRVNDNETGFYQKKTNDIISIDECLICEKPINEVIKVIKAFIDENRGNNIESIMIRHSNSDNSIMIKIIGSKCLLEQEILASFTSKVDKIKTIILNNKIIYGEGYINDEVLKTNFKISYKSFFQVNSNQIKKLYQQVIKYAKLKKTDTVLDLYCGTGSITCLAAQKCGKAIGIETLEDAINDALDNVKTNNIDNTTFICGKVEEKLLDLVNENIDVVILDPARNGSDEVTLGNIIKLNPRTIIYVSCNPVTLARDLKFISANNYIVKEITPVDMFPQTSHVECVALIERKL